MVCAGQLAMQKCHASGSLHNAYKALWCAMGYHALPTLVLSAEP